MIKAHNHIHSTTCIPVDEVERAQVAQFVEEHGYCPWRCLGMIKLIQVPIFKTGANITEEAYRKFDHWKKRIHTDCDHEDILGCIEVYDADWKEEEAGQANESTARQQDEGHTAS